MTERIRVGRSEPLPFVQIPTLVIRDSNLSLVARILYAVISTYADLASREAILLRSTLAKDVGKSRDTIDRAVQELEAAGLLSVERRRNDRGVLISSMYTLHAPKTASSQVEGGRTDAATPMGMGAATGMGTDAGMGMGAATPYGHPRGNGMGMGAATVAAPMRHITRVNERESDNETETLIDLPDVVTPSGATDRSRMTLDQHFDAFWFAYPRKVGKEDARRAWDKARRKVAPEVITAGAIRLRDDPNLPAAKFIPHPSTWLTRGGWDDEAYPNPNERQRSAPRESPDGRLVPESW